MPMSSTADQPTPTSSELQRLRQMLQAFIDGQDRSRDHVGDIEELLVTRFRETEIYDDVPSVPVASYNPAGGQYLYDEDALASEFRNALAVLKETFPETNN